MEQDKGNKNKNEYLREYLDDSGGDFDNLLKEKMKGWTNLSDSQILQDQKLLPIKKKQTPVENVVVDSSRASNSSGTEETVESSEVSNVEPVVEAIIEDKETENKETETTEVKNTPLQSNPEYSRQIIEGRVPQIAIRGIKSGPWTRPQVAVDALPANDKVLETLGLPDYASIWKNARSFYVRTCEKDVEKLIKHINKLETAAFRINLMKEAGRDYLASLLVNLTEEERGYAETLMSKMFREKADRSKPGISGPKKAKSSEPKERKLSKTVQARYDMMIDELKLTYDKLVALVKQNPPDDVDLVLMHIKTRFGKA